MLQEIYFMETYSYLRPHLNYNYSFKAGNNRIPPYELIPLIIYLKGNLLLSYFYFLIVPLSH